MNGDRARSHMGQHTSSASFQSIDTSPNVSVPGSKPDCMTRRICRIHLISGRLCLPDQHPACGGQGYRTTRPFLCSAFSPDRTSVRRPRSARIDQILVGFHKGRSKRGLCLLHDGTLNDDPGGCIFPKRDQQLARQRDDGRLLQAPAIVFNARFKPLGQGRVWLVSQP
jgi:hypothetical protein